MCVCLELHIFVCNLCKLQWNGQKKYSLQQSIAITVGTAIICVKYVHSFRLFFLLVATAIYRSKKKTLDKVQHVKIQLKID